MSTEVTLVEKLQSTQDLTQRSQTRGQQAAWLQLVCTNKHLAINIHTLFTGLICPKYAYTYALPAFTGQLTADDRNLIGAISRKAQRRGVSHTALTSMN